MHGSKGTAFAGSSRLRSHEQLITKVSNLDGTLQEQKTLNQTLQLEVARAHEQKGIDLSERRCEGDLINQIFFQLFDGVHVFRLPFSCMLLQQTR